MAIIKCFECGKEISDKVDNCIHCGCPNYKKQYAQFELDNDNKKHSLVDVANAIMILLEANGINGYNKVDKTKANYHSLWLRQNCESLDKDINIDIISLLSNNPQKDFELLHSVISHEVQFKQMNSRFREKKTDTNVQSGDKKKRVLKKCLKCGRLNAWNTRKNACIDCSNTTYEEIEYPCFETPEEEKIVDIASKKLFYILNEAFSEIIPGEDDYFGCIEMCDYLKEKYSLQESIYELVGIVNQKISHLEYSALVPEFGKSSTKQTGILLDDGRYINYSLIYYSPLKDSEYPSYMKCSDKEISDIEANTKAQIMEICEIIKKYKSCTTGLQLFNDYDFDYEDMKKARIKCVEYIKSKREYNKKAIEARNKYVQQITQPVKITDPNYVETATCPNCHQKSVYKISTVKRTASIGFFGLLSKNLAKTMECRSCGYKW